MSESKDKNKSESNPKSDDKGVKQTVILRKSEEKSSKKTFETLVVSEEVVDLYEHRVTHWKNDVIVSDVRKLLAKSVDGPVRQKIVTTEKISIPEQSMVVPIGVNKQIGDRNQESTVVGIPIKIQQMEVPVIESVEVIEVPNRTIKRTTQPIDPSNDSKTTVKEEPTL